MKKIEFVCCLLGALTAVPAAAGAAGEDAPPQMAQASGTTGREAGRAVRPAWRWGVDDFIIEAGHLPDAPEAKALGALRATPYLQWQPSRNWEFRAGLLLDAASQSQGPGKYSEGRADWGDTFVRWRDGDARVTFGAQTIVWGRVDAVPLIDRVSRTDLTRFVLDSLPQRRAAQWALRWEQGFGEDLRLDAVVLPYFLPARLADERSVWSLVNRQTGRIIGLQPSPALQALVAAAPIRDAKEGGAGGVALRLTRTGEAVDWGVTLGRTRQALPYYQLGPTVPSLTVVHPYNNFIGVDAETAAAGATWRAELGYTDGTRATQPSGASFETSAVEAVAGVEFTPGGGDTRVILQLAARSLRADGPTLERKDIVAANGEVEMRFGQGRWKAALQFSAGLNHHDLYLAPKLSYLGWEPHEFYIVARHFDGSNRSLGGFHRDHSMIALGLRTRF